MSRNMDNTRGRVEKKAVRFKVLRALFIERHDYEPKDLYEKYMLELISKLGEVYDDTTDEIRTILRKDVEPFKKRMEELRSREMVLNNISALMRKGIGISAQHAGKMEPGEVYERRPRNIHQSRPRESSETLHEPSERD